MYIFNQVLPFITHHMLDTILHVYNYIATYMIYTYTEPVGNHSDSFRYCHAADQY